MRFILAIGIAQRFLHQVDCEIAEKQAIASNQIRSNPAHPNDHQLPDTDTTVIIHREHLGYGVVQIPRNIRSYFPGFASIE